ncbi:uncharacterized protein LTHEOB_10764 [Lasiodiplodia theobromae]|uniref:uncharacterized protein n=1 Tax=Lasiodiplodia theobromae TaxID=45133 RepID=UPI0015C33BEC|nr:uncharacterized protein LTHEOB_10764 [Lasiodiplodia theobromae]KAF4538418.1 hypothetical protein LTHEOB_10764 [Lasiodiplodia theobromae]
MAAPLREETGICAEPESPSASEKGSDDGRSSSVSPPISPFQLPKGKKGLKAQRFPGGRGEMATSAIGVGLVKTEDMDMFNDMGAPRQKRQKITYGASRRTAETVGGGESGKAKKTVGYGDRTTTSSSERLPGEGAGGENEERRAGKRLKTLEPIAMSPTSPRLQSKATYVETTETRSPRGNPKVKFRGGIEPAVAKGKENSVILKTLLPIHPPPQPRTLPKVMKLAPLQAPHSPKVCTRGSSLSTESQYCEVIDLTTSSKAITLSNSKSDTLSQDGPDTPTKRRTLKALPSIDSGISATLDSKATVPQRSSRRNKSQAERAENVKEGDGVRNGNIKVSSPLGFDDLDDDDDDDDDDNDGCNPKGNYETPAKCPICQAPVDRILLEEWQGSGSYMRIRKQMAFCEAHRRATACEEYAAREYPEIDFDALVGVPLSSPNENSNGNGSGSGGRIERFRDELVAIVRKERPSAFRDVADAAAAKGEGRNLKTTSENDKALAGMSVGYYGPRGRRLMEEWVTNELAGEIRLQAGRDRLIGFKTVSGFIQEVLVPELAMRLVAEDLDVGEARAREVLRESGEIGELVNGVDEGEYEGEKGADEASGCMKDEDGGDY